MKSATSSCSLRLPARDAAASRPIVNQKKIHAVIDARSIRAKRTGIGNGVLRQLLGLERMLAAGEHANFTITAIRFAPDLPDAEFLHRWDEFHHIRMVDTDADHTAHPAGDWWQQRTLPAMLDAMGADVLFSPAFIGPARGRFRRLLMIHDDLIWSQPSSYPAKFRAYMDAMIRRSAKGADRILYPSQDARQRCDRLLNSSPEKSAVLHHGIDAAQFTAAPLSVREKFIVCIASGERRKNHEVLIRAMANQRDLKLVFIGIEGAQRLVELRALMENQEVEFIPSANESAIRDHLRRAVALALPTRGEGFGLPVLEAMACGTPVILSDIPVMHEVAADAATYVDPDDVKAWKDAVFATSAVSPDVQARVTIGLKRTSQFTLEENARKLLQSFS